MSNIKSREDLIKVYIDFFKSKNHKEIINSPLIPANDPTVLFTTAGMHPLVPFLIGNSHPLGNRLVNVQRCIRTGDINEVGDDWHLTFFEMLGNWSLGDYFKKEAIEFSFEFLTKVLKIPREILSVSVFEGDSDAPRDNEAADIWKSLGIAEERIAYLPKEKNWWGPAGLQGPCGPDTEMFYWIGKGKPQGNPKINEEDWAEIWNDVFMQYNKNEKGEYEGLKQRNVDTGMGTERVLAILMGKSTVYETPLFIPIIKEIEKLSKKEYKDPKMTRSMRIIADHIKASVMILAEKQVPSNIERGYVLRRLIRRAIRHAKFIGLNKKFTKELGKKVFDIYKDYYHLEQNKEFILKELESEEDKFSDVIEQGMKYFNKNKDRFGNIISGKEAFLLYQSYGFPIEMTQELAKENSMEVDVIGFEQEQSKHQKLSQTSSAGVFKAGLADSSEISTKYHTATHLLHAALRQVLGEHVEQRGSNITAERMRFDFSHDEKLTSAQIKDVENIVNQNIQKGLDVKREEMSLQDAKKSGATGLFESKYGEKVSVYAICDPKGKDISKEICSGPHVTNTKDLGKFRILKEEASAKGVRRIKGILE